jgi:hypothetical protein
MARLPVHTTEGAYKMMKYLFSGRPLRRSVSLAFVVVGLAATPAFAATPSVDTSSCTAPTVSQPFLFANDSNWYTLLPGESAGNFSGSGWTLSGGAQVITTTLPDGLVGQVLNLPSGSKAVSPTICVNSADPTARTMVRNVTGAEGVQFYVSYEGTNTWTNPQNTGQVHGQQNNWTTSDPVNIQPSNQSGWQLVRFTFVPGGQASDFQIFNFYVDPRMSG